MSSQKSATSPKAVANPDHPKLKQAQELLKKNPTATRKSIRKELKVADRTITAWIGAGLITLQPYRADYVRRKDNSDHPLLKQVQEALAKDPSRTMASLTLSFGVSRKVLASWRDKGWITLQKQERCNNTLYWLEGSDYRPYDPSMVPTRKKR